MDFYLDKHEPAYIKFRMAFFNQNVADIVQCIAWPIEALAIFLILTELFSPRTSEWIEGVLDKHFNVKTARLYAYLFSLLFSGSVLIATLLTGPSFTGQWFANFMLLVICTLLFHFCAGAFELVFDCLNSLTDNRALGALGLILALIAFIFETYQFATLFLA